MPVTFWEHLRISLRREGAPPTEIKTVGEELPIPTLLIIDSHRKPFAFSGLPLGMSEEEFTEKIIDLVSHALNKGIADMQAPSTRWEELSPAELAHALEVARSQLKKWLKLEPEEIEIIIKNLRNKSKK